MQITETQAEVRTSTRELTPEQRAHAELYGKDPEKVPVPERDNGGDLCTICKRKGCRIGPMGRG